MYRIEFTQALGHSATVLFIGAMFAACGEGEGGAVSQGVAQPPGLAHFSNEF